MVIHDGGEMPEEVSILKEPLYEQKSCIFGKNLGLKFININQNTTEMNTRSGKSLEVSENAKGEKITKRKKKSKKQRSDCSSSTESDDTPSHKYEISVDLDELKTVYRKCKDVMKKIETKYGHLLDLDEAGQSKTHNNQIGDEYQEAESKCQCTINKKIVFDEDGKEVLVDSPPENHICPKKMKLEPSQIVPTLNKNKDLQIEYSSNDLELSDDLQELASILQNPDIETTYRNQVIDKVRLIKMEHMNEIKFNKPSLVEKLKINPEEVLDFKGTNLSTLSGYS